MANWRIKEFSQLTHVSVRTLHHYDHIGLLKPSMREENGYRLYSTADLLKLQQIIALKYFGSSLKQIHELLNENMDVLQHLKAQESCLKKRIFSLKAAAQTLEEVIAGYEKNKSIDWQHISNLIEVYQMTEKLKKTWAGKVYSDKDLQQFSTLRTQYSEAEIKAYENRWISLIEEVKENMHHAPSSSVGQRLGKAWKGLLDEVYGGYPDLKASIREAYKGDKIPDSPIDPSVMDWIEKAQRNL